MLGASSVHARFLQVDPVGYDDEINLYEYVGNDPLNRSDPNGTYTCPATRKNQCVAVEAALQRAREALKSDKLSSADRGKLGKAVNFFGAAGKDNGVQVVFSTPSEIQKSSGGRTDTAFTNPTSRGNISVTLTTRFSTLYNDTHRMPQYSRVSGEDQRGNLLVHEADHGLRFKAGQSLQDYNRNVGEWEHAARQRGMIVNKAFGSEAVCQADNSC